MKNSDLKKAAVVAFLLWYFWPRQQAQAQNTTDVSIRTNDSDLGVTGSWRDFVFF